MPGYRIGRISEDLKREIIASLQHVKDPRVHQGLVSIVRVDVTNDLSYATVYVSSLQGLDSAKEAVAGLKCAEGFIKKELGKKLRIRRIPSLIFKATDSIEYGAHISKILNDAKRQN